MPEQMPNRMTIAKRSGNSRRVRFSLGALMLMVTLCGVAFGVWGYHRPARAQVTYEVIDLPRAELDSLGGSWNQFPEGPFAWKLISESEREQLRKSSPKPLKEKSTLVTEWPAGTAQSITYSEIEHYESDTHSKFMHRIGSAGGFIGVRKAGGKLQLRVFFNASSMKDDRDSWVQNQKSVTHELHDRFVYEGQAPKGYLVVAAPLGPDHYHSFLFHVEEVQKSPSKSNTPNGKQPTFVGETNEGAGS